MTRHRARWTWVTPTALAACAGAVDLLALAAFGGAFASVVTGNLVIVGLGIGRSDPMVAAPAGIAVAGFTVGVAMWVLFWRARPHALVPQLIAEQVLLIVVAGGWWGTSTRPAPTAAFALLALASIAMGGQSVAALRLQVATTYLTGTLTGALHDLVTGERGRRTAGFRQLIALLAGAAAAAVLLIHLRWSVPLLPILLLGTAIAAWVRHRPAPT